MQKIKLLMAILLAGYLSHISPVYSQPQLIDSLKNAVVNDINAIYGKDKDWRILSSNDLNRRYQIFDILTLQSASESIRNGRIYYYSLLGDDQIGSYLLLENNSPKIIRNFDLRDLKKTLEFMYRNDYTQEQIIKSLDFIINRHVLDMAFTVH